MYNFNTLEHLLQVLSWHEDVPKGFEALILPSGGTLCYSKERMSGQEEEKEELTVSTEEEKKQDKARESQAEKPKAEEVVATSSQPPRARWLLVLPSGIPGQGASIGTFRGASL